MSHLSLAVKQIKLAEKEELARLREISKLRSAGTTLIAYLRLLGEGKLASETDCKKIESALRVFS